VGTAEICGKYVGVILGYQVVAPSDASGGRVFFGTTVEKLLLVVGKTVEGDWEG
jgi:hypothetical protein